MNFIKLQETPIVLDNDTFFTDAIEYTKHQIENTLSYLDKKKKQKDTPYWSEIQPMQADGEKRILPFGCKQTWTDVIGTYIVYYKNPKTKNFEEVYVGTGRVSQRINSYVVATTTLAKGQELGKSSDSRLGRKMANYDNNIKNWYFSFCVINDKQLAANYEKALGKKLMPKFNDQSMLGKF